MFHALQRWRYRVDGCYLWSTGSWDVLAIYPESTSSEGSYFDPVVADIIAQHNKKVCCATADSSAYHAFDTAGRLVHTLPRWQQAAASCHTVVVWM